MFRRKRAKEDTSQPAAQSAPSPTYSSGGYVTSELPTFDGRKRKVIVYSSDANGKIIKRVKKG